ncbi:MAG: hypothetical protein JWN47_1672 [Frankiales bacterium]|jgi:PPOX class probable F420-dependent enzyme|nr:hypothetical protein [Frankiales bacterium]MDQ1690251.1 hypothetical protein [Pseudonocardiales bacterium]
MAFEPTEQQQRLLAFAAESHKGVLVTIKQNGRAQLSNIIYTFDPDQRRARISVTADRAKTRNALRDPRVTLHVSSPDFWSWAALDGHASLTDVATDPDDDAVAELIDLYRAINGEHPDWDEYRAAMVRDRRQVLTVDVENAYGQAPGAG